MGALSIWHVLIVAAIIVLLFGGHGRISDLMGDAGKGIRGFRTGMDKTDTDQTPLRAIAAERHEKISTNA